MERVFGGVGRGSHVCMLCELEFNDPGIDMTLCICYNSQDTFYIEGDACDIKCISSILKQ